jgi:hypothetical protein
VSANKLASPGEEEDVSSQGGGAELARVKGKLVSAMMKKHLVEAVVPVLVELRRMLGEARHPLLGALLATTAALLKEYKAEVEDILVADKQVGAGLCRAGLCRAVQGWAVQGWAVQGWAGLLNVCMVWAGHMVWAVCGHAGWGLWAVLSG